MRGGSGHHYYSFEYMYRVLKNVYNILNFNKYIKISIKY